jgi:hypothetical protein
MPRGIDHIDLLLGRTSRPHHQAIGSRAHVHARGQAIACPTQEAALFGLAEIDLDRSKGSATVVA